MFSFSLTYKITGPTNTMPHNKCKIRYPWKSTQSMDKDNVSQVKLYDFFPILPFMSDMTLRPLALYKAIY